LAQINKVLFDQRKKNIFKGRGSIRKKMEKKKKVTKKTKVSVFERGIGPKKRVVPYLLFLVWDQT
jgi:hypothetical protein